MTTKTQRSIADMLRKAGRKVTVIDSTKDSRMVEDERLRAAQTTECGEASEHVFRCTLPRGHTGEHEAWK